METIANGAVNGNAAGINYPIYFVTGGSHLDNAEEDLSLSELETIDIEVSSSDDDVSLSGYDLIEVNEKNNVDMEESGSSYQTPTSLATPKDVSQQNASRNVVKKSYTKKSGKLSLREIDAIIEKWRPLLQCANCKSLCSNYSLLQEHYRREHPRQSCSTLCCGRVYSRSAAIAQHIRLNHSGEVQTTMGHRKGAILSIQTEEIGAFIQHYMPSLMCVVCSAERPSFEVLKEHFRQQHPTELCYIVCCGHKLKQWHDIAEHIRVHIYADSFKCELCHKVHLTKLGLDRHMLNVHRIVMGTTYRHSSLSVQAERTNSLARPRFADLNEFIAKWMPVLECELCSRQCSSFTLLVIHFRELHPKEQCYVRCCDRKLKNRHQLEEHIHLHNDPRGFKCEVCEYLWFTSRSNLFMHMCTQHPLSACSDDEDNDCIDREVDIKVDKLIAEWNSNIQCGECSKSYAGYTILREHFRKEHSGKECYFSCCGFQLQSPTEIAYHIGTKHSNKKTTTKKKARKRKTYVEEDEHTDGCRPNLKCEVHQIISSTPEGRFVLDMYRKNETLTPANRTFVVREVVQYYMENLDQLKVAQCREIAQQIVELFPTECLETYYTQTNKCQPPKGKIWDRYQGQKRYLRKNNIIDENFTSKQKKKSMQPKKSK